MIENHKSGIIGLYFQLFSVATKPRRLTQRVAPPRTCRRRSMLRSRRLPLISPRVNGTLDTQVSLPCLLAAPC